MSRYVVVAAAIAMLGVTVSAQKITPVHEGKGGSPHVRTDWKEVAPYGRVWRAGADEATTLKTDKPLKFGTLSVPAGTYTLFTLPGEKEWQLIVSKKAGQWATQYSEGDDLGRVPMQVGTAKSAAEQLTYSIDDTSAGGTLRIEWGTTSASVPFTVGK